VIISALCDAPSKDAPEVHSILTIIIIITITINSNNNKLIHIVP